MFAPLVDPRAVCGVEPLLLAATRVSTFDGPFVLTHASGFLFARDERIYLVTSRHVLIDTPTGHRPNRIEIELHTDENNLARSTGFSVPLYRHGKGLWRQGRDAGGEIDVAVLELERSALPSEMASRAFTPAHLVDPARAGVEVGQPLLVVGFPMGFHDTLHHLPVVRQAIVASSFGMRFQGHGYFLTDARTHRGTSGAPVVMRLPTSADGWPRGDLPWALLGVHSARLDVGHRDLAADESLGLNCAWYADILMTLTRPGPGPQMGLGGTVTALASSPRPSQGRT